MERIVAVKPLRSTEEREHKLLLEAALETFAEIEVDVNRLPPDLRPFLEEVLQRFLEPGFGPHSLPLPEGWRGSEAVEPLRARLGEPVRRYIAWARIEIAARLLRDTELSVASVANLVGYSDPPSFRKAFKRRYRTPPSRFRAIVRATQREVPRSTFDPLAARLPRRLARGPVDRELRLRLLSWLRALYLRDRKETKRERATLEEMAAEELWLELSSHPFREQRKLVRQELDFSSLALFRLLGSKVVEGSRKDRKRGVEVAELALAWLDVLPAHLETSRSSLEALAWAWLGNAHRLAEDFEAAERCFATSQHRLKEPASEPPDPRVEAEVYALQGTLRLSQGDFAEAKRLLDHAISFCRALGLHELLIRCLLQRTTVVGAGGDPLATIPDHHTAIALLDDLDSPELKLKAYHGLATNLTLAERYEEAEEALGIAQSLCLENGYPLLRHQLELVAGKMAHGRGMLDRASKALEAARAGMIALDLPGYTALASLELALLRYHQERFEEAAALASEALPIFNGYKIDRETRTALEILRKAILANRLSEAVIVQVRDELRRLSMEVPACDDLIPWASPRRHPDR
jgi:tetratricopeptide (TPR) repeat protein